MRSSDGGAFWVGLCLGRWDLGAGRFARAAARGMDGGARCVEVFFIIPGDIAGLRRALELQRVLSNDRLLDHVSARLVDRVGDIRVQFVRSPFDISQILRTSQSGTALIAVVAAKMILGPATPAASGHLATGHGDKGPIRPFDDLQISDHKTMVECDGAESPEAIFRFLHELDSNLGDFHGFQCTPLVSYDQLMSLNSTFRSVPG